MCLWLPSPDVAVARVRRRVEAGGHDLPDIVVRRRFQRSLFNLGRLYRPLATTWRVYDGSAVAGRPVIAHGAGAGEPFVLDPARWRQVREAMEAQDQPAA